MEKITCPRCKAQILLVPDLREMTLAIAEHTENHVKEMQSKNMPKFLISRQKNSVEEALIQEVIKEIYEKYAPSPMVNS